MQQNFKIFQKTLDVFVLMDLLEILSHYPDMSLNVISPIGLVDILNGSWINISVKDLWFNWLRHFLLALFC